MKRFSRDTRPNGRELCSSGNIRWKLALSILIEEYRQKMREMESVSLIRLQSTGFVSKYPYYSRLYLQYADHYTRKSNKRKPERPTAVLYSLISPICSIYYMLWAKINDCARMFCGLSHSSAILLIACILIASFASIIIHNISCVYVCLENKGDLIIYIAFIWIPH